LEIGIVTNAYKEENWIQGCILQFYDLGFDHLILNSISPWGGNFDPGKIFFDKTKAISEALGAMVIRSLWISEADQLNFGLEFFKNKDWVLIVDADERYSSEELRNFTKFLADLPEAISVVKPHLWDVYWRTHEYRIIPEQPHKPIIAVRPTVRFTKNREASEAYTFGPLYLHHFSYVRSDEEMKKKIESFSHAHEIVPDWYDNIWLKWTHRVKNLHPVHPEQFYQAVWNPCPPNIKDLIP